MATKLVYRRCNRSSCRKCSADPKAKPHGPYVHEKTYIGLGVSKNGNVQPQYKERYIGPADEVDVFLTKHKLPKPRWATCAWCGKPFKQKVSWQSYCRTNCRSMAYQKRRRQFQENYERTNDETITKE